MTRSPARRRVTGTSAALLLTAAVAVSAVSAAPATATTRAWHFTGRTDATITDITSTSVHHSYAVGTENGELVIWRSHDAGKSWKRAHIPAKIKPAGQGEPIITASTHTNVWVMASTKAHKYALHYNGEHWTVLRLPSSVYGVAGAVAVGDSQVWIAETNGASKSDYAVVYSGGKNFYLHPLYMEPSAIDASSADNVWVSGIRMSLEYGAYTRWNGKHWSSVQTVKAKEYRSINDVLVPNDHRTWLAHNGFAGDTESDASSLFEWNGSTVVPATMPKPAVNGSQLATDRHAGLWLATRADGTNDHWTGNGAFWHMSAAGTWTRYPAPTVKDAYVSATHLVRIPKTTTMLAVARIGTKLPATRSGVIRY